MLSLGIMVRRLWFEDSRVGCRYTGPRQGGAYPCIMHLLSMSSVEELG